MKTQKQQTSIRLSTEAKALIESLSQKLGVNQSAVLEMAVRLMAEKEKVR